jgi:hypothetical protein
VRRSIQELGDRRVDEVLIAGELLDLGDQGLGLLVLAPGPADLLRLPAIERRAAIMLRLPWAMAIRNVRRASTRWRSACASSADASSFLVRSRAFTAATMAASACWSASNGSPTMPWIPSATSRVKLASSSSKPAIRSGSSDIVRSPGRRRARRTVRFRLKRCRAISSSSEVETPDPPSPPPGSARK